MQETTKPANCNEVELACLNIERISVMKPLLQMPYSRTSVCAYRFLLHRFLDFYYQIVPRACNPLKTFALVYCLGLTVLDGDFGVTFARYNRVRDEYVIPK